MKFSIVTDILFYSAAAFLLTFTVLRYYALPLWLCIVASLFLAIAVGMIAYLVTSGKYAKKLLNRRERNAKDALILHLTLDSEQNVNRSIYQAYRASGKDIVLSTDNQLYSEGKRLIPLFTMEAVSADIVASFMRKHGMTFALLCNKLSPDAEKLAATFEIPYILGDEIFRMFRETNTTPNPLICGELPRRTLKTKMRIAFSKQNARPFFVSGSLLLIMSLFVLFPVYYLISGAILLSCSVIVRFFGYADA